MRKASAAFLVLIVLALGGCRAAAKRAAERELREAGASGSLTFLDEAGRERYTPPADGLLTPSQIDRYVTVQKKLVDRLRGMPASSTEAGVPGDLGLDERIARELGTGAEEYLWIRGRVLEARLTRSGRDIDSSVDRMLQRNLEELRKSRAAATDDRTRGMLDSQIRTLEDEIAGRPKAATRREDPATAENARRLESSFAEIERLGAEIQKLRPFALPGSAAARSAASTAPPATSAASATRPPAAAASARSGTGK